MFSSRFARIAAIAALAFVGSNAAALASMSAYTRSAANLREGPGTGYGIITSLPRDTEVEVNACTSNWCAVTTEDDDEGFIAITLLKPNLSGSPQPFFFDESDEDNAPPVTIHLGPGDDGEDDMSEPEVCFYQQANFRGANFCVQAGDQDEHIPGSFDNNIESITVGDGLEVQVCRGINFVACEVISEDTPYLPPFLNNKISSYAVE
jgi:hypothetical protein